MVSNSSAAMRLIAASRRCLGRLLGLACALLLLLLLPPAGRAGEVAIGNGASYPLSREFSFLEDPGGKLSLQELLQPAVQQRFAALPVAGTGANFGFTRSAIWLRVTLRIATDAPRAWLLEVAYAPLDHLELYTPGGTGWISLSDKGVVVDGRLRGSVWVIRDITRRKQLEEQLRSSLAAHEAGAGASTPSAV